VPLIAPVLALKLSPAGSAGVTDHAIADPVTNGVSTAIAVPAVSASAPTG
jgi:hypothetical protein